MEGLSTLTWGLLYLYENGFYEEMEMEGVEGRIRPCMS